MTEKLNGKYKLLEEDKKEYCGMTLRRVKALKSFGDVKKGDIGGYIEDIKNLSVYGNA